MRITSPLRHLIRHATLPLFLAAILLAAFAAPAGAQQWQRFAPPAARSSVDAGAVIAPSPAEPSLATAQANTAQLQALINANDEVRFTQAGDYYFSGRITLDSNTTLHIRPGVNLWRHSGAPGVQLFQTIGTSQTTDIMISGGGSIGRRADASPTNDDGHTVVLWHVQRVTIRDIVFRDNAGPLFSNRDGKYAVYFNRAYDIHLENLGFVGGITEYGGTAVSSDGVHFSGAVERVRADNLWGGCVDNPFAVMNRDYGAYEGYNNGVTTVPFTNGSVRFFHVSRLHFTGSAEIVRLTGRFMPTARVNDLDGGAGVAAGGDHTVVAWTAATRVVSKTGMFAGYTWADGDFLLVTAGTGVKQAGGGGEPSATDVTVAQPLALPIIRKINNDQVEVGVIVNATDIASMTVTNGAYTSEEVSDILVEGVTGGVKPLGHGLGIGLDDTADPGGSPVLLTQAVHRRITLRNISVAIPTAGYSMIQCAGVGLRELTLEGTIELANGSNGEAVLFTNTSSRTVMDHFDASRATWRARPIGTGAFSLVNCEASARIFRAGSFDVVSAQTGGACTLLNIAGDDSIVARIDDFSAGDIWMQATASGSLLRGIVAYNGNGAQIRRGIVNSLSMTNAAEGISGALNTGTTAGVRSRLHVNTFRVLGTVAVAAVRAQADVTYDSLIRDTNSGELAYGATNDTLAAPSMQPANTITFTLTEADFTAAALTQTVTLSALTRYANYHLPRAASVVGVRVEIVTAFDDAGGPMSASTIDVGIVGTATRFVAAQNAFALGGTYATPSAANAFFAESAGWPALAVTLNTTGANVVAATTGLVKITITFE
jgi:hypothetical protein